MDSSHSAFPVHDPNTRHTQAHLHPIPQIHTRAQTKQEYPPPSKRRRANSANPPSASPAEFTTSTTSTHWQSHPIHSSNLTGDILNLSIPRNASPDQASRVSAASSQPSAGPQLRKKPKVSSIKNNNLLRVASAAITKSHSLPVFQSTEQPQPEITQTPTNKFILSGPSISRTNSGTLSNQSPNQKRPPASHSSYGVETVCGPPPSYSTQRTLSQERIRKVDRNTLTRMQTSSSDYEPGYALDDTHDTTIQRKENTPSMIHSSPDTADTHSIPTPTETENTAGVKIRGEQRVSMEEEGKASSSDERKSEDLFLNIARVDAAHPSLQRSEKRRSRISIPFLPVNRQSQVNKLSPVDHFSNTDTIPSSRSAAPQYHNHNKHASLGGQTSSYHSQVRNHLLGNDRFREQTSEMTSDNERNENMAVSTGLRRASTTNTESTRLAQRSSAGLRGSRLISESTYTERPKTAEQIATESTVSTTAPSTVWDELDDLKSRIRKLELTGKLPPSSAAAMASSERPKTATTAATTMSTSPKYKASETNLQSTVEDIPGNIHPLLYEALDNARVVLSHEVYQKLQATAHDALQLAAMMNRENPDSRNYGAVSNDRQIRRRTESMCRGLTELAIALAAEAKPVQPATRPVSRDQSLPPNSMLRGRRYSNDPVDRNNVQSRVQSRLDSRRTSLHLGRNGHLNTSPERAQYQSPSHASIPSDARINRSSTLLRKRGQGSFDGTDEQFDASPSIRPGSRAMTDLGAYRRISRDQLQSQKDYTSQHPLPTPQEQELALASAHATLPNHNHMGSNFTSRRKYASPASVVGTYDSSPVTPREAWGRMSSVPLDTKSPDAASEAGGQMHLGSTRRSLGFAGRIGSSVGSRLRGVRAERNGRDSMDVSTRNRETTTMIPNEHSTNADTY